MSEKYFLGCMTAQGFSTEFGRLIEEGDRFTYILKGGAGTGKSSLMKKIAAEFETDEHVVRFYCSSDPASLDAVWLEKSDVLIVDGTSPHVFDPIYPGAAQVIINLGENWNSRKLADDREKIIAVTDKNKSLLARAKRFTTAFSNVCSDSFNCAQGCIDEEKLNGFLTRFCKKMIPKKGSGSGRRDIRQLSAMTEFGWLTMTETLESCQEIYMMHDEYFACSHRICESVAAEASRRGFDVIICPSHGLNDLAYEHIIIPELGLAMASATPLNDLRIENAKQLNLSRFYDKMALQRYKSRLKMNRLTAVRLADEIYITIKNAKAVHDEIEKYYIEAMDHSALDRLTEKLIKEIKERK